MKMKVCIVTSWFPNKNRPMLAPFVYRFARDLVDLGLDVFVITNLHKGEPTFVDDDALKIYRINEKYPLINMFRLLYKIKPSIIHIQAPNYFSSFAIPLGKIMHIPVIATVHRAEIDSANRIVSIMRKIVLLQCLRIIAVSNYSLQLAIKAGASNKNTTVIYNSCDESLFKKRSKREARRICSLPYDKKVILFVGNIIKIKGIYTLIESLKKLKDKMDFLAVIIGTGEEEKRAKNLVDYYSLNQNIKFLGWLSPENLSIYYNAADVFVLPSFTEGHSVAILEAMTSGVPIVACNVGGNNESIQNGINGVLVRSGDAESLAYTILRLLTEDNLHKSLSEGCINVYREKFSKKNQLNGYLENYYDILKKYSKQF